MGLLETAQRITEQAHSGQFRRDGVTPYIEHPMVVASKVGSDLEKATALLHDVLEDTHITAKWLLDMGIPSEVVDAVVVLTKKDGQNYTAYLEEVAKNPIARAVKIADMISNLNDHPTQSQLKKYGEGLAFLSKARS